MDAGQSEACGAGQTPGQNLSTGERGIGHDRDAGRFPPPLTGEHELPVGALTNPAAQGAFWVSRISPDPNLGPGRSSCSHARQIHPTAKSDSAADRCLDGLTRLAHVYAPPVPRRLLLLAWVALSLGLAACSSTPTRAEQTVGQACRGQRHWCECHEPRSASTGGAHPARRVCRGHRPGVPVHPLPKRNADRIPPTRLRRARRIQPGWHEDVGLHRRARECHPFLDGGCAPEPGRARVGGHCSGHVTAQVSSV